MLAIFKKEFKSYFYSPIAYVLLGLLLFLFSVLFYLANIRDQSADFNRVFSTISFILIIIVPFMTMRVLAEEKKNGTEVLLVTSPVSLSEIVIGKYLAMLSVFMVMTGLILIYPLVILLFGNPPIAPLVGSFIGFILLGAALISIGVFASSLTENQIVAAVISFVIMLFIWIIEPVGIAVGGWLSVVLSWLSLSSRYDGFTSGLLDISSVIYYISFIAVFLFITIRILEKRRWSQG